MPAQAHSSTQRSCKLPSAQQPHHQQASTVGSRATFSFHRQRAIPAAALIQSTWLAQKSTSMLPLSSQMWLTSFVPGTMWTRRVACNPGAPLTAAAAAAAMAAAAAAALKTAVLKTVRRRAAVTAAVCLAVTASLWTVALCLPLKSLRAHQALHRQQQRCTHRVVAAACSAAQSSRAVMLTPAVGCWRQFTRIASDCTCCVHVLRLFPWRPRPRVVCMSCCVAGVGHRRVKMCAVSMSCVAATV